MVSFWPILPVRALNIAEMGQFHLLGELYDRVYIPETVGLELNACLNLLIPASADHSLHVEMAGP